MGAVLRSWSAARWERIEREVLSRVQVLSFGEAEARLAGEMLAALESRGQRIDVEDVLIGATARAHSLTVATRNERHLGRIPGLVVENWWS